MQGHLPGCEPETVTQRPVTAAADSLNRLAKDASETEEGPMTADTPVLDTLADMTVASVEHNALAPRELMLVRIAALIAVDAPPASYLANAGAAKDTGVTADDLQGVMIAVAPVVGAARVISAGGNILRALGFAIAVADAEMADDTDARQ